MKEKRSEENTAALPHEYAAPEIVLLLRARSGDEQAFAQLVAGYRPMLGAAVAQYRGEVSTQDLEELEQEALVAFHRAAMRYDVRRKNVRFGLYAKVCVNKAMISTLRRISRNKKRFEYVPLEAAAEISADSPADSVAERESEARLRSLIKGSLSDFENTVWWLYYSGADIDSIAARTGKPKRSVENALGRARKKLRTILTQSK